MLRLTIFLCLAMFATLLIGGRDYGQMRPALVAAKAKAEALVATAPVQETKEQPIAGVDTDRPASSVVAPLELPLVKAAAEPAPKTGTEPAPVIAPPIWYVTARSVNVREGPSTDYAVIGKLTRGEAASVLFEDSNGWARILIEGDGIEGFVSSEFLSPEQ